MSSESLAFWLAVGCYGLGACAYFFGFIIRKEKLFTFGVGLVALGLAANISTVALRWIKIGLPPFMEISESLTSAVLIAALFFLIAQSALRQLKALGVLVVPVLFILLGWAGSLRKDVAEAIPASLQSGWLWLHIFSASMGFSAVLLAARLGFLFLLRERNSEGNFSRLPEPARLDDLGYRFIGGGFVLLGLMIISGALWANQVKGAFWNWDPVEVWSLIVWLVYGMYLHLHTTFGWRGRKPAWYALIAIAVMIVSYWGVPFLVENFHSGFRIEHK